MSIYTLVAVDVSGIQDYVFGSNKLQHIIGASELVHRATHDWVRDALPPSHNLRDVKASKQLNPELKDFNSWLNENAKRIPLE